MTTYTEQEVKNMLAALIIFSNADDNQGLRQLKGRSADDKTKNILQAVENADTKTPLSIFKNFVSY